MQLSSSTLATLRKRLPSAVLLAHRSLKARKFLKTYDQWRFFAEKPADLRRMKLYRREYFPKGGPVPWLDRPDADQRIVTPGDHEQMPVTSAQNSVRIFRSALYSQGAVTN